MDEAVFSANLTRIPRMTHEPIKDWSLTSLKEKLIKIGAKVLSHGRYVVFQWPRSQSHGRCPP
jgi:hypothetical protein